MPKIMIVEDEVITRMHLQEIIRRMGYNDLIITSNGDEALKEAERFKPDVALMDISIKGEKDGIEVAHELSLGTSCSVIFLTAHGLKKFSERSIKNYYYLAKPFKDKELKATILNALSNNPHPSK